MSASFVVGQTVYVVSSEHDSVVPLQIVEQISRRSLDGETISYMARKDTHGASFDLSGVKGEVFPSLDGVRDFLHKRFETWMAKQLERAIQVASTWDPTLGTSPSSQSG